MGDLNMQQNITFAVLPSRALKGAGTLQLPLTDLAGIMAAGSAETCFAPLWARCGDHHSMIAHYDRRDNLLPRLGEV